MMAAVMVAMFATATPAVLPSAEPAEVESQSAQAIYNQGTQALDRSEWDAAADAFERVVALKDSRADAALYWRAYALNKSGKQQAALRTLAALKAGYPQSRWVRDAGALEIEIRQAAGQTPAPAASDNDELKLLALSGLMQADPDRAIPLVKQMLQAGGGSAKVRERAMFVLAQSGSPEARQTLIAIARGTSNPGLQLEAIKYLGLFGGDEGRKVLSDVFASSKDVEVGRAVLQADMVSGNRAHLLEVARSSTSPELRRQAFQMLGASGAKEELWQLYQQSKDTESKRDIINGLFVSGGQEQIQQIATKDPDVALRVEAIQRLGLMGEDTAPLLKSIYTSDKDAKVRRAVLNGFFVQGNAKALVEIARQESDPALKREAVQKLSVMGSKEATDYMLELLK
jgi:HEAT repeat protein